MDFLTEMLYALTSAYSHRDYDNRRLGLPVETLIGKLFSVLAWGLNDVQKQAELIRLWDDIDHARGSVLDRYGANFGVKRFGADDRFYRLAIKVKLLAQLSGAHILDAASKDHTAVDGPHIHKMIQHFSQDIVPCVHSHVLSIFGLYGPLPSPKRRIVDNIIMDQGRAVDHLNQSSDSAQPVPLLLKPLAQKAAGQHQAGPQPLSRRSKHVSKDPA